MEPPLRFLKNPSGQKGHAFALVIVLVLVVLMAVMILAFFLSIRTDSKATTSTAAGQVSRQLADVAVQTVISQIQTATTYQTGTVAWASQPGMIRCYDSSGTDIAWYKLYSSGTMVQPSPGPSPINLITADVPTQNWATAGSPNYGVFTDINSPVISSSGTLSYPVVDPSGAKSFAASGSAIIGFDVQNAPGYVSGSSASATNNPAAMPVRWLYVLKSGTLVPGVTGVTPGQVSVPGASGTNPIVGRVAFWTDDETCKLNINTAADGTYFDSPRFEGPNPATSNLGPDAFLQSEKQFAVGPPAAGEYQRYIGNPAQTKLSFALPQISGTNSDDVTRSQIMSNLSPFMQWGGSQGGELTLFTAPMGYQNPFLPPNRPTPYASLDEWMFSIGASTVTPPARIQNTDLSGTNLLTNLSLNKLHFFLTAASDAPEVTLYGKPRVAMWPISNDFLTNGSASQKVTPLDQMIAAVSTLPVTTTGSTTYYFTRSDSTSGTNDWAKIPRNQAVMQYLRSMAAAAVPGYGGVFNTKYSNGQSGNAAGMDQILTEIFDYVRSTNASDLYLTGSNQFASPRSAELTTSVGGSAMMAQPGIGQVVPISISNIAPSVTYKTKGFGRFYTINEISLDFTNDGNKVFTTGTNIDSTKINVTGLLYLGLYSPSLGPQNIFPDIRVEVDDISGPGTPFTMTYQTSSGSTGKVFGPPNNGQSPNNVGRTVYSIIPGVGGWANSANYPFFWGGAVGPRQLVAGKESTILANSASTPNAGNYELCGLPFVVSKTDTITISPETFDIKVYYSDLPGNSALPTVNPGSQADSNGNKVGGDGYPDPYASTDSRDLVQEIIVQFPGFTNMPVPTNTPDTSGMGARLQEEYEGDLYNNSPNSQNPISQNDLVRSLIAGYNGDMRLVAAQGFINISQGVSGTTAFVKHPSFDNAAVFNADTQRDIMMDFSQTASGYTLGGWLPGTPVGPILSNLTYNSQKGYPVSGYIDPSLQGTSSDPAVTGDFDNGLALFSDGPYINKPDEGGNAYFTSGLTNVVLPYYNQGAAGGNESETNSGTQALGYAAPNRILASPVMFGSLSTGVPINGIPAAPWRTLLFRPQPTHFGATSPEDKLLLDWFWMPVVEPYAISTPMATQGKVNMNYQIAPFTYITRATALAAVLASEYVIAVPNSASTAYKSSESVSSYRYPVYVLGSDNVTVDTTGGTLRQFNTLFNTGEIFKSASDICDIYLVPQGQSFTSDSQAQTFWSNNQLTGDNSRERPYNGLYPRLTTKSNTYTVHVRAQALRASSSNPAGVWIENPQRIQSEWRGSYTVNRYVNPEDPNIPDFTTANNFSQSLENYYKYRVLETRRFLP